jgi:hypothetical protein
VGEAPAELGFVEAGAFFLVVRSMPGPGDRRQNFRPDTCAAFRSTHAVLAGRDRRAA